MHYERYEHKQISYRIIDDDAGGHENCQFDSAM